MPIDRLSSTSSLIAALRAEVSRKGERKQEHTSAEGTSEAADAHTTGMPRDVAVMRRQLAELVKDVSSTDAKALDALWPKVIEAPRLNSAQPIFRSSG